MAYNLIECNRERINQPELSKSLGKPEVTKPAKVELQSNTLLQRVDFFIEDVYPIAFQHVYCFFSPINTHDDNRLATITSA